MGQTGAFGGGGVRGQLGLFFYNWEVDFTDCSEYLGCLITS